MKTGLDSTGLVPTDCLKWGTDLKQVLCVDRFGRVFFFIYLRRHFPFPFFQHVLHI